VQWNGEMEAIWLATANGELRSEVLALKQKVERLRAAGDALAEVAAQVGNHRLGRRQTNAAIATWQEARRE